MERLSDTSANEPALGATLDRRHGLALLAAVGLLVAVVARVGGGPATDEVPAAEVQRRDAAIRAAQPLHLDPVATDEVNEVLRSFDLPWAERAKLREDVLTQRTHLVWLALFDSDAEDGDRVLIQSAGVTRAMLLTKKPVRVALPLSPDGRITITGVDEGSGGGVTVGIVAGGVEHRLPPMRVRQTFTLMAATPA